MLELCFDINTYHILKILQAENVIDSFHHIIYLYDDLSIGSLNVKNLEERITSLQALKVNYDFHKMIKNYKDMLSQIKIIIKSEYGLHLMPMKNRILHYMLYLISIQIL